MSIEACGLYSDEEIRIDGRIGFPVERQWNGHLIEIEQGGCAFEIKGYPNRGWGEMKNLVRPMATVGGSAEGRVSPEGVATVEAEVTVSFESEGGATLDIEAGATLESDFEGNVNTEGSFKISFETEF